MAGEGGVREERGKVHAVGEGEGNALVWGVL